MAEYITKEGMRRLHKRMNELIKQRPMIIQQVVIAREMGDLSENAEYHAAREKQRVLENEFNRIKSRISKLQVVDPDKIPKDAVRFGACVTIKELSDNKNKSIRLVGIDEIYETTDGFERMSVASPIGKAMIGKKIGEVFSVKTPLGNRKFEIMGIN